MTLAIRQLAECMEHLETVGGWIYEQWWRKPGNTPEIVLGRLRQHTERDAIPLTLVAIERMDPVGCCCLIENDCPPRPQYSPWVAAVFVRPDRRRRGVASALLQEAAALAGRLGIEAVYIDCWAKTAPLYERNGWSVYETDVGQKDSVVMIRRFAPST